MRSSRWICKKKPSPERFLLGMKMMCVTAKETMLVGDSIRNHIVTAKVLGILVVQPGTSERGAFGRIGDKPWDPLRENRRVWGSKNPFYDVDIIRIKSDGS